ncbi:GNAT family N-acetyltransferase [Phytoactinopolyspora halotolerans]|uniref:GNAT family N-acetyltransferase n=1 Tax=Phytoactinopolyspora halotolerans TaxID=1981512 RepID=A0A6L9S412_9ACTN|nr:GNAT family N-acetyltransferase [Phytoactinopolyspora halotolerans]
MRLAEPVDVGALAQTLTRAFADYSFTRHVISADDHLHRLEKFNRLFVERIGIPYGRVWMTDDAAAVSVWTTPQTAETAGQVFTELAPLFADLAGDRAGTYAACDDEMARHRPGVPTWFLGSVGVAPDRQGQGLGRAVIEPGLRAAESAGTPAFLETSDPRNVELYARLGFTVMSEYVLPHGGPRTWSMIRPAVRGTTDTR